MTQFSKKIMMALIVALSGRDALNITKLEHECQRNQALCGKLVQAQEGATVATDYRNNALVLIHGIKKDKNLSRQGVLERKKEFKETAQLAKNMYEWAIGVVHGVTNSTEFQLATEFHTIYEVAKEMAKAIGQLSQQLHIMMVWAAAAFQKCLESGEEVVGDETMREAFAAGNEAVKDVAAVGSEAVEDAAQCWYKIETFCDMAPVTCATLVASPDAASYGKASDSALPFAMCAVLLILIVAAMAVFHKKCSGIPNQVNDDDQVVTATLTESLMSQVPVA